MPEITPDILFVALSVGSGLILGLSIAITVAALASLRTVSKDRQALNKELFGLVKKIEMLTSSRREQMLKHYDGLLEVLSTKLPTAIATQTGQVIFDTESKILSRLAEIEPNLTKDDESKKKLDELIRSMEGLEKTIVNLTSDTVHNVMIEGRKALFDTEAEMDFNLQ